MNKTFWMFPLAALLIMLSFSCNQDDDEVIILPITYELGESFTLKVNEAKPCICGAPSVQLETIVDDSRCPAWTECVSAGEVTVRLDLDGVDLELTLGAVGSDSKNVDTVGDFTYTLINVTPYPQGQIPIEEEEYEIELRVDQL